MQEKSKFLSVRLTAEEREHLDRLARESGLSLSKQTGIHPISLWGVPMRCAPVFQLEVNAAE